MDQWPVTSQELSLATGAGLLLSLPGYGGTLVVPFCLSGVTLNECLNPQPFGISAKTFLMSVSRC